MNVWNKVIRRLLLMAVIAAACSVQGQERQDRPKIGLVLSGGGAKGFAHIGTLQMLDSLNIPVDYIVGTSMGGIIGALYSIGYSGDELMDLAFKTDWEEVFNDTPARTKLPYFQKRETGRYQLEFGLKGLRPIARTGLIYGQKIYLLFSSLTLPYEQHPHFDDLPIPFRCIAVDLVTGNEVVLEKGSLAGAMRATMAIPSVFSPVELGDSLLVDGGMLNKLPTDIARDMGADIIIAVDVSTPMLDRIEITSAVSILEQSQYLIGFDRWKKNVKLADILITPDMSRYSAADFIDRKVKAIIKEGDIAAHQALPKLCMLQEQLDTPKMSLSESNGNTLADQVQPDEKQKTIINSVFVQGNKTHSFLFIYRLLEVQPGDVLDIERLNDRIMDVYGLGYFEHIQYTVEPVRDNLVNLMIQVKEHTVRKLRLGLRYDSHHKLVANASVKASNILIPGLRVENELQFAGLYRWHFKMYYPSQGLNLPVYPFFQFQYKDIPIYISSGYGKRIATYGDRSASFGAGLGMVLFKSLNMELEYRHEKMDIAPIVGLDDPELFPSWDDYLRKIKMSFRFDTLDDVFIPRKGFVLYAEYENSSEKLHTGFPYIRYFASIDMYRTFFTRHTARLYAFWGGGSHIPVYKYMYQGNPDSFIGMQYDQLRGSKLSLIRFDYRFQVMNNLYVKVMANTGFNVELNDPPVLYKAHSLFGYGIGIKFMSIPGPVEYIVSRGDENLLGSRKWQTVTYFKFGYRF